MSLRNERHKGKCSRTCSKKSHEHWKFIHSTSHRNRTLGKQALRTIKTEHRERRHSLHQQTRVSQCDPRGILRGVQLDEPITRSINPYEWDPVELQATTQDAKKEHQLRSTAATWPFVVGEEGEDRALTDKASPKNCTPEILEKMARTELLTAITGDNSESDRPVEAQLQVRGDHHHGVQHQLRASHLAP